MEEQAVINSASQLTTLTAWFKLNSAHPPSRSYLYREIPHHFWFDKTARKWKPRKKRINVIGRIYSVSVKQVERHSLRLLLINVPGATSFEYLRTVDGILHSTFKEAAIARNLMADDSVWERVMAEAVEFEMPIQLRQLFVNICVHCSPTNAQLLFNNNLQHLTEDFTRRGHEDEIAKNLALKCIQDMLRQSGHNLEEFQLPVPDFQMIQRLIEDEADEGADEVRAQKRRLGELMVAQLNMEQQAIFDRVMASVNDHGRSSANHQFFLDGPGGTGKTFLYNALINVLEGQRKSVIAVASTGIASILLINGSTYHSRFKIYPPITETTTSKIEEHHVEANNIRKASLIIIDEVTMMTVHALDAIDKLFRKITKSSVAFGGKVLLLGGDFRQCLPVIKHGNRVKIVESTIKSSRTWSDILKLRLSRNMRTAADTVSSLPHPFGSSILEIQLIQERQVWDRMR
ncbi:uncharacterized protein LOC130696087 [Daphnia carinata]|uniref:uncharacterized protein LOC130696087 n=1 Tax=Daphnia carinata TaxID=120202 RepID=UPI00257B2BF5|nr:uncharacterized protein LOC130696087 [Daphnia carinata]